MRLVLEHNLFSMHLAGLRERANKFWKSNPKLGMLIKVGLMEAVYDRCSVDTVINFLNSQYQAISGAGIEV